MKHTARDFYVIADFWIGLNDSHIVGARDRAEVVNGFVWNNRPMISKMDNFGYASRRLDSAELRGEVKSGKEVTGEEGFSDPGGAATSGAAET